jgi:hypothetical protein
MRSAVAPQARHGASLAGRRIGSPRVLDTQPADGDGVVQKAARRIMRGKQLSNFFPHCVV